MKPLLTLLLLLGAARAAADEPRPVLGLEDAVALALSNGDPSIDRLEAEARALEHRSVSDAQLEDPTLSLGLVNMPIDTLDFTQSDMTQVQTTLRQAFPPGKTLKYTGEMRRAQSRTSSAAAGLQRRRIVLDTRAAWLEMFYWSRAEQRIAESMGAVAELEEATRARLAAGRGTAQNLMRLGFELSLLEDRLIEAQRQRATAQADLSRYTGQIDGLVLPDSLPALKHPETLEALRALLPEHPALEAEENQIAARQAAVQIAEERYKPAWALQGAHSFRGGGRDDFASVGVTVSLPLFTGKRQDLALAAAKRERQAAELSRRTRLLDFERRLERTYASWQRLGERIGLYEQAVMERAAATTEASLASYQAGVTDFDELVRARLAELDAALRLHRLQVDHAQAQAELLFLEGDRT